MLCTGRLPSCKRSELRTAVTFFSCCVWHCPVSLQHFRCVHQPLGMARGFIFQRDVTPNGKTPVTLVVFTGTNVPLSVKNLGNLLTIWFGTNLQAQTHILDPKVYGYADDRHLSPVQVPASLASQPELPVADVRQKHQAARRRLRLWLVKFIRYAQC